MVFFIYVCIDHEKRKGFLAFQLESVLGKRLNVIQKRGFADASLSCNQKVDRIIRFSLTKVFLKVSDFGGAANKQLGLNRIVRAERADTGHPSQSSPSPSCI